MSKEGGVFPDIDRPRHPDFNDKIEVKGKFISFPYSSTPAWFNMDRVVLITENNATSCAIQLEHDCSVLTTATIPQILLALNSPHLFVK